VALCYYNGWGASKNYSHAARLLLLTVQGDDIPEALNLLGKCYELGHGLERNTALAISTYRRAGNFLSTQKNLERLTKEIL